VARYSFRSLRIQANRSRTPRRTPCPAPPAGGPAALPAGPSSFPPSPVRPGRGILARSQDGTGPEPPVCQGPASQAPGVLSSPRHRLL